MILNQKQVLNSELKLINASQNIRRMVKFWSMPLKFVYKMPDKLLHHLDITINGILCIPNVDYHIKNNYIFFNGLKHNKSSYYMQILYEK